MARRNVPAWALVLGALVAGVGGCLSYRQVTYQRTVRAANEIATQLGLQPDDLLLQQWLCSQLFQQNCGTYLHFTTELSIEQMRERVQLLGLSPSAERSPLNGHGFVNEFISNNPDRMLANGQDLYQIQHTIPEPRARGWGWSEGNLFFRITLYETSRTGNTYEFRGKPITENIVTVVAKY